MSTPTIATAPRPAAAESPAGPPPAPLVSTSAVSTELAVQTVAAAAGSLALTWLAYERLLPVAGWIGFWVVWYLVFLAMTAAIAATVLDRMGVVDRVVGTVVTTCGLVLVALLAGIVFFTAERGWTALKHWNFFHETTAFIGPDAPLSQGGIYAAMVGTFEQVAISMVISVPLGIATAIYLSEVGGGLARLVRSVIEAMSAVPTIVAGLFIYSMLVLKFGQERSGFAASLALCVSMIPVVTMTAEVVLRLVPGGLREASLALGTTRWQTVRKVVLPTARPGLVTAVLLGVARVIGETSPVLLVAGSTSELNYDPTHGPQLSLPLFVFNQMRLPLDQAISRAFGAAVVLLLLVVVLFSAARLAGGRQPGRMSRRDRRQLLRLAADADRRAAASASSPTIPVAGKAPFEGDAR